MSVQDPVFAYARAQRHAQRHVQRHARGGVVRVFKAKTESCTNVTQ